MAFQRLSNKLVLPYLDLVLLIVLATSNLRVLVTMLTSELLLFVADSGLPAGFTGLAATAA